MPLGTISKAYWLILFSFVILNLQIKEVIVLDDIIAIIIFSSFGIALLSTVGFMGYATVKQYQIKQKQLEIELIKLENESFLLIEQKQALLEDSNKQSTR